MAFEVISANQITGYEVDDNDTVTLLPGTYITSPTDGFDADPGIDSILVGLDLRILGTVSAESTGVNLLTEPTLIVFSRITIGPDAQLIAGNFGIRSSDVSSLTITNSGYINSESYGIFVAAVSGTLRIINEGSLLSIFSPAIGTGPGSGEVLLENSGTMLGSGGTFSATVDTDVALTLDNSGQILTTGFNAISVSSDNNSLIVNTGLIGGEINLSAGNDRVRNAGHVTDDVNLGGSSDIYDGSGGGEVLGTVYGEEGNDTLRGSDMPDRLDGGTNNDLLVGRGGDDTLLGGNSPDVIRGGDGNDEINGGNQPDTINGNAGDDTINGGTGDDDIRGGSDDDLIDGFTGDDTIRGDSGDDRIIGGDGRDDMWGGSGRDVFIFEDLNDSGTGAARDRIYDFQSGQDTLDISALAGPAFTFRGSAAFTASGSPEVRAVAVANGTLIYIDFNGDGTRDSDIYLIGTSSVTDGDFLL